MVSPSREEDGYYGKIVAGRFMKGRNCSVEDEARIIAACSDPAKAAIEYGIGPICRAKYGF